MFYTITNIPASIWLVLLTIVFGCIGVKGFKVLTSKSFERNLDRILKKSNENYIEHEKKVQPIADKYDYHYKKLKIKFNWLLLILLPSVFFADIFKSTILAIIGLGSFVLLFTLKLIFDFKIGITNLGGSLFAKDESPKTYILILSLYVFSISIGFYCLLREIRKIIF